VTLESLTDFAQMVGIELLLIDAETTTRQFEKELRWNQAYYRLAQSL
jgi:L-arabinose isomerase